MISSRAVRESRAHNARTKPTATKPVPSEQQLRRTLAHADARLTALEASFPGARAREQAKKEQARAARAQAEAVARDTDTINAAFGVATRQGVERVASTTVFHTVDPRGSRLAAALEQRDRGTHTATRGDTQIAPRTAPPSSAKSPDDREFDRAFGAPVSTAGTAGIKRTERALTFDAAGAAHAARERLARRG